MSKLIQIGKILNTHGIKGDLKIAPLTDDAKRFEKLSKVYIDNENTEVDIDKIWYYKNFVMIRFKGYDDINDVLKFKNSYILIEQKDTIKLPENTYFIYDIIGLNVFTKDSMFIGIIDEVLQPGGNDVYVVKDKENNKSYLIPAIKEVVKEVNINNKTMIIEPIEGMIE